jgi:hypothetical protein
MSKTDIYRTEVKGRRQSIDNLELSNIDVRASIEEFNKLDESYKVEEKTFREELECIYLETRHYTGQWPIVYSFNQTGRYPFFNGSTDDDCNPYYRISFVQSGQDDGLAPVFSEPTRSGGPVVNRQRSYPNESNRRSTALAALQAYPDRSNEGAGATGGSCSGEDNPPQTTEAACISDNGTWNPEYQNNTAVDLLQNALNPWKSSITQLKQDLCNSTPALEQKLQDIIDEIDNCISLLPAAPTYPDTTPDPEYICTNPFYTDQSSCEFAGETWFSPLQDSIDAIIDYIQNDMVNDFDSRGTEFAGEADILEQKFFGIMGLRLHQVNGSYAKLQQLKEQLRTHLSLIEDHKKAIANINVLIVNEP